MVHCPEFHTAALSNSYSPYYSATGEMSIDSLNITDSASVTCDTVTGLAITNTTQTTTAVNWTAIGSAAGYEVVVNQSSSTPSGSGVPVAVSAYNAIGLTAGTLYYVHVRDSCGPGNFSAWTTITFSTDTVQVCDSITGLATNGTTSSGTTISWNAIVGTLGYEIAVTQSSITPASGTGTPNATYGVTGLSTNTVYHVYVRDSCDTNSFSAWDTLSFSTSPTGITNINDIGFGVDAYPNPTNDIITVKVYGMKGDNRKVSLTDVAGRVISVVDMTTDKVDFNMTNLAAGIYLIRYEDDEHTRIIKVNKQ